MKIDMTLLRNYDYEGQREQKVNCPIYSFNGRDDDKKLLEQSLEWEKFTKTALNKNCLRADIFI